MLDLAVTLKSNQFICSLVYIISENLVKFYPLVCKLSCQQEARLDARKDGRTHLRTDNDNPKLDNCNCHGQLPGFTIMNVRMMLCIVNVQNCNGTS